RARRVPPLLDAHGHRRRQHRLRRRRAALEQPAVAALRPAAPRVRAGPRHERPAHRRGRLRAPGGLGRGRQVGPVRHLRPLHRYGGVHHPHLPCDRRNRGATMNETHHYDALVVGGGGAGLMAALYLARNRDLRTAVLSKLYPTRSHTGAAQGGIGAALGNLEEDHPEWHAFDTVKGSDYLGDQDAIELMCNEAVDVVLELEHMGLPFSRTDDGRIAQRRFGGHTRNFGEGPVRRSCYAADRTGHMILQTLYQQCIKAGVTFFDEFQVLDLVINEGRAAGVVAYQIRTGDLHVFRSKAVLLATGGFGRMWAVTSNALAFTGDGPAMAYR